MGGIETGSDALEFLALGATAVAVGTANFRDPQRPAHGSGATELERLSATGAPRPPPQPEVESNSAGFGRFPLRRAPSRAIFAPSHGRYPRRTAAAVPERTHYQRMRALRRANDIRTRRAQLKRDLKAGKVKVETLLLDPPDWVMSAKVFDMILAVPKYGRVKANKILAQCRISPSKTIGGLSQRQRAELVQMLRR